MATLREIDDKYYQYCNVVMLSSNEKAEIGNLVLCINYCNDSFNEKDNEYEKGYLYVLPKWFYDKSLLSNFNKQHLYIISNDEIKEGDWVLDGKFIRLITDKDYLSEAKLNPNFINWKKIIATTDTSLKIRKFKKGVLKNLEYNLPLPSQQFIEKFIEDYNNNVSVDGILVEYEKATYEEWMKNGASPVFDTLKVNNDNTINIKLIKESYTRAEVISLLNDFGEHVCNELLGHKLSMIGELNKWANGRL